MKLIKQEFIFGEPLPTPECHASTILVREDGRKLAAWFAGTKEANPDVLIFVSRFDGECWSAPRAVTPEVGVQHWNPVLFLRENGEIILYFKYLSLCRSRLGGRLRSSHHLLVGHLFQLPFVTIFCKIPTIAKSFVEHHNFLEIFSCFIILFAEQIVNSYVIVQSASYLFIDSGVLVFEISILQLFLF